ncbi:MAG: DMT family transporter [Pseudomonadota bacterium]|nr:DMT family transporter [Pseudomonadota bacterium]
MASNHRAHGMLPVLALLAGSGMWGLVWYPMRLLNAAGLDGIWLTLILYASALVFSLPRTAPVFREYPRAPAAIVALMLAGGWTNVAFLVAVLHGDILRVMLLFYLSPLWATLLGWLVLGERVGVRAQAGLALAMAGALLMLWNPQTRGVWPHGASDWLAISSGFAFAVGNVMVRQMKGISVTAKSVAIWVGVLGVGAAVAGLLHLAPPHAPAGAFAGAVALGIFGILVMTLLVQYGVTHMPVHRSAVIMLFELVAGALSQQQLAAVQVGVREWAGGALIMTGAYLAALASG